MKTITLANIERSSRVTAVVHQENTDYNVNYTYDGEGSVQRIETDVYLTSEEGGQNWAGTLETSLDSGLSCRIPDRKKSLDYMMTFSAICDEVYKDVEAQTAK